MVVAAAVVIGVIWWQVDAYGDRHFEAGKKEVQDLWDADKLAWSNKLSALTAEYRNKEAGLRAVVDASNKEGKAREARIAADLRRAVDQLRRERNSRPGGDGVNPPAAAVAADGRPGTCSGRELYADDAAVLKRLAAELDRRNGQLRQCIGQYNAARDALKVTP